jgi:hypothetical protein
MEKDDADSRVLAIKRDDTSSQEPRSRAASAASRERSAPPPEVPRSLPDGAPGVRLFSHPHHSRSQKRWCAGSGDDERADITPGGFKGRLRLIDTALVQPTK